jgi:DNA-binding NarL/FixJ family response regulator
MSRIRVFWVDDSKEFVMFAQQLLEEFPRLEMVGTAHSAEAALAHIERLGPDLVLMDLAMAGMSGLSATRLLTSRPNPPRVVLVTGSDTAEYRLAARNAGADGFLAKPDLMQGLMPLVEELFAQ